jgi:hypothetical protein
LTREEWLTITFNTAFDTLRFLSINGNVTADSYRDGFHLIYIMQTGKNKSLNAAKHILILQQM